MSRAEESRVALDEALAHLTDERDAPEPIRPAERAARRRRLAELLAQAGLDALLCEPGATLRYLAGVEWSLSERLFGLLVPADGAPFWIAPAFEVERARHELQRAGVPEAEAEVVPWQEHEHPYAPLVAALAVRRVERLAVDPALRHGFVARLARALGHATLPLAADLLVALRGQKDAHELALLRRASELTQRAIAATAELLRPGMSGAEIGRIAQHAQRRLGLADTWDLSLVGPAAAHPHGTDYGPLLERGALVLVDTGGALHGYQSDCTRTWIFDGAPTAEVEAAWHAVRDAQRAAFETLRPGTPCRAVDAAARRLLEERGFGPGYRCFAHRLGHGIGLEGHEEPYLDGGSEVLLAPGMTVTDEPGVYLPERFGLRLEDVLAVTKEGPERFGRWQSDPRSPA